MIKLSYISVETANKLKADLTNKVLPSENRVLVFTPNGDEMIGGVIIPGEVKEGKPRKGVVILSGVMDADHQNFNSLVQTGMIITYGLYAGKEVEFETDFSADMVDTVKKGIFTILDTNEIIMAEANK